MSKKIIFNFLNVGCSNYLWYFTYDVELYLYLVLKIVKQTSGSSTLNSFKSSIALFKNTESITGTNIENWNLKRCKTN